MEKQESQKLLNSKESLITGCLTVASLLLASAFCHVTIINGFSGVSGYNGKLLLPLFFSNSVSLLNTFRGIDDDVKRKEPLSVVLARAIMRAFPVVVTLTVFGSALYYVNGMDFPAVPQPEIPGVNA